MKKFITSLLALALIISSCSCDNGNKGDTVTDTSVSATEANVQNNETNEQNVDTNTPQNEIKLSSPEGYKYTKYKNANTRFMSITLDNEGNIYGITDKSNIKKYDTNGKSMATIEDSKGISNLYYANGYVYGFDPKNGSIVRFEITTSKKEILYSGLMVEEVKNLCVIDNTLYILIFPTCEKLKAGEPCEHDHNFEPNAVEYINFNEILYAMDLNTKELVDLKVPNIIAMYASADSNLYVYTCKDSKYELRLLDKSTNETTLVQPLDNIKYVFGFVYENDKFVYYNHMCEIDLYDMKTKKQEQVQDEILVKNGSDMQFYNGNAVYIGTDYQFSNTITDADDFKVILSNTYLDDLPTEEKLNQLVVYGRMSDINTSAIERHTGIKLKQNANMENDSMDAITTKILAKDDSIDIFASLPVKNFVEKKIYVPLNDSKIITDYLDGCFDYVKDAVTLENGDIYGLPISVQTSSLWYNPTYFEQFGITPDDVKYVDGFLKTAERLDPIKDKLGVYALSGMFCRHYETQYDIFYNDFANNTFNYDTEIYRYIYEHMWAGWLRYSEESNNMPHLQNPLQGDFEGKEEVGAVHPSFKSDKVIMKWDFDYSQLQKGGDFLKGWRVLPEPILSDKTDKTSLGCSIITINPYSKNKEKAIKVLECIAQNLNEINMTDTIIKKDLSTYEGVFDTTQPAFMDLYNIYKNGYIPKSYYYYEDESYIDDFQAGTMTVDEVIAEKTRRVKMALFE